MKTFGNSLLLVRFVCSCVMLAALYLCLGDPLYAQTSSSPACPPSNSVRGDGNDIQCRINNVLNSGQNLITTVGNQAKNCTSSPHCSLLTDMVNRAQRSHDRGMRANGRLTGDDYADLNTIRKAKCKGAKSDCATGSGSAMYSGGDTDPNVGLDMADQLDDATNALDSANSEMQNSQTTSSMLSTSAPAGDPPATFRTLTDITTDPSYPAWLVGSTTAANNQNLPNPPTPGARYAALLAGAFLTGVKDGSEDACKQEVVVAGEGGNTSLACLAISAATDAAEEISKTMDLMDEVATGLVVTGTYQREDDLNTNLGHVDSDVLSVQAAAGNTQASITLLQAQVTALQVSITALQAQLANTTYILSQKSNVSTDMDKQIMQLLLSPDGSRSLPASLLTCTGDSSTGSPCPPVAITCSATTGSCSFSPH